MPISPENMLLYPGGSIRSPEWLAIRDRILEREDNRCKFCRAPNRKLVFRPEGDLQCGDDWYATEDGECFDAGTGETVGWVRGSEAPAGKFVQIILTIAHLDGLLDDHSDENLAALCQRCHNILDAPQRARNAAKTRRGRKAVRDMFE